MHHLIGRGDRAKNREQAGKHQEQRVETELSLFVLRLTSLSILVK